MRAAGRSVTIAAACVSLALGVAAGPSACGRKTEVRPPEFVAPKAISQLSLNSTPEGVVLRWTRPTETMDGKSMDDLGGFVIERAVSSVGFREVARVPVTDRGRFQKAKRFEHLDRDVVEDATYHYRIVAFTTDEYYSAPSGPATIKWSSKAPSVAPTGEPSPAPEPPNLRDPK